ncbi:unnamed protein product [Prorocentrum cordatum]|uniref:Pentatricopeptide repeat-containing protein, chloroplastic n=1 Tax=Prorocentrum cordatum TaxID=2364126 RepID=A0ABN9WWU5_9DINO|nr:unnamed protein product [Polarella glacialis]
MPGSVRVRRARPGSGLWRCSARCGRRSWSPTSPSYNAGISACEKGDQWRRALALLGEMREAILEPNSSATVLGSARARMASSSSGLRCCTTGFSYNAGISACEKRDQWQRALALLGEMWATKLKPDAISYGAAIFSCAAGMQWKLAQSLLSEMWLAKLVPDVLSYNAGISACEKGEQWQRALALLGEMREVKLEPDVISSKLQRPLRAGRACAPTTTLGSARARNAISGSGLWRCSARCGRRSWSPTSSATALGSARARKVISPSGPWQCSAR